MGKRFEELEQQIQSVEKTKKRNPPGGMFGEHEYYESETILGWAVKVKNLLIKVAGENSEHYKSFLQSEQKSTFSSVTRFNELKAIFLAAREDYEGGYLSSYKSIVQAEVFDTELEQATELLNNGYYVASAVIAGTVLETAIRELCSLNGISHGKLDKMNADLAKANIYNMNVQKQVTAIAALRNSAAHGKSSEFGQSDVKQMIDNIILLLATHLSVNA